jgi:membrane protease YdiL (CAAX protease family)
MSDILSIAILSVLCLVLALIFVVGKIAGTKKGNQVSYYEKSKRPLYVLHIVGGALATIFIFTYQGMISPTVMQIVADGILGIALLVLLIGGIIFIIKTHFKPMDEAQNQKFKSLRVVMWIFTILTVIFLIVLLS